jgi:hypothetical protein
MMTMNLMMVRITIDDDCHHDNEVVVVDYYDDMIMIIIVIILRYFQLLSISDHSFFTQQHLNIIIR